jgi:O-antigen/teichoic acid export membrane protein
MNSRAALFYNALALLSVGIGLLNSLLTIRLLGISVDADIWLLGLAMISTLCILSQLGVEQFLYFHEEQRALGQTQAIQFLRAAVAWAVTTGVAFTLIVIMASPFLTLAFASGLSTVSQDRVVALIIAMAPQIAAAPLLHVTRQHQNAVARYTLAYLLLLWSPAVLLFILLCANMLSTTPEKFAWVAGAGGLIQIAACMMIMWPHISSQKQLAWSTPYFRRFISTSVAMRSGHALHNFLSSAIINSTLSNFSVGNVAIFQYANRFAAGATTIAVGPHSNIFHTRIAKAWADVTQAPAIESARQFLTHIAPIYVVTVIAIWLALPPAIRFITQVTMPLDALAMTFLLLSVWYGVIQLESVFVAIIIAAHGAAVFVFVNGLFATVFYSLSRIHLAMPEYAILPAAATLAQLISLVLYALVANRIFERHFQTNLGSA